MLHFKTGDIFESGAKALVNPVNCVGVSGKGLAKEFAQRFPGAQRVYESLCRFGDITVGGDMLVTRGGEGAKDRPHIIFFPTKKHWRDDSKIGFIDLGLRRLHDVIENNGFKTVALPALGCGLGKLRWDEVKPKIESRLSDLDADIFVFEPKE